MVVFLRLFLWVRKSRQVGLWIVLALVAVAVLGNALCFHFLDPAADRGFGDALWYSVVSITTIGYGDYSATTLGARLGTVLFIMVLGLTAFTLLLGLVADFITDVAEKGRRGMAQIVSQGHVLLVNYPGETRIRQIIRELQNDEEFRHQEIVIIADAIDQLPFSLTRVSFVRGSPLGAETYERAALKDASIVVVLSPDYADARSDAVVASAVAVIERLQPDVRTVAECLDDAHRVLFDAARCNSIVCGPQLSSNLLTQETRDPGVARTVEVISSNLTKPTLYSTEVSGTTEVEYVALAKSLVEQGANLLSVIRGDATHTTMPGLRAEPGDRLIYIAAERLSWPALANLAGA